MKMMAVADAATRLTCAETELASAEAALDAALHALVALPREQKVAVSSAVQAAFATVRSARERLAAMRCELAESDR